jgi:hypothetical protein
MQRLGCGHEFPGQCQRIGRGGLRADSYARISLGNLNDLADQRASRSCDHDGGPVE